MSQILRDTKNYNGEAGVSIDISALGCVRTDYGWLIMPSADPGGDLGAEEIVRAANAVTVYNSGDARTAFVLVVFALVTAPEIQGGLFNVLDYGSKNFAGDSGVTIDISGIGDATYINPFVGISPYEDNEDIGEVYYTLAANAITVYNGGDNRGLFAYCAGKHN